MTQEITCLDCTLRDGSYLIDYGFTAEDTYTVCIGLANAGVKMVEVGHGTGLGSNKLGAGKAIVSDEAYLEAAHAALKKSAAKFGMFFIPGIATMEDLELAAKYEIDFIRIGTNVTEVEAAEPFISRAKELGIHVASNLMKSYVVPIDEFIKQAAKADQYGADVITVVDSAGGMFPEDVREYVTRLRDMTDKHIGFHGHNNLQLAIANTLEAAQCGARYVDACLQGMGRSAGNAQMEIVVLALEKMGFSTGIDPYKAMDMGERIIKPMMRREQGVDGISVISGIAQFHSSFLSIINKVARQYDIDPRKLIYTVSEIDRVHVTEELAKESAQLILEQKAAGLKAASEEVPTDSLFDRDTDSMSQASLVAENLFSLALKTGKESVLSITLSKSGKTTFPFVRQSPSMIIANCDAADMQELHEVIEAFNGKVDWILFDSGSLSERVATEGQLYQSGWYSEKRIAILSLAAMLAQKSPSKAIPVIGSGKDVDALKSMLAAIGDMAIVHISDETPSEELASLLSDAEILISFDKKHGGLLRAEHADLLSSQSELWIIEPGAFCDEFWDAAVRRGRSISRVDTRVGLATELKLAIETSRQLNDMGLFDIDGIPVVAGGAIGPRGTVIVNSRHNPTTIVGVADGKGGLLYDDSDSQDTVRAVQRKIVQRLFEER